MNIPALSLVDAAHTTLSQVIDNLRGNSLKVSEANRYLLEHQFFDYKIKQRRQVVHREPARGEEHGSLTP